MDANGLIEVILSAHERGDGASIAICEGLRLEPQMNYNGKMARDAYRGKRVKKNRNRLYAGILDFKIIASEVGMEHERLIRAALINLTIKAIRHVHSGADPMILKGLNDAATRIACTLQASFVEQELNWGKEPFQLWTYFGTDDVQDQLLRSAAPRDFQMVYLERCAEEVVRTGNDVADVVHEIILSAHLRRTREARNLTIQPPLDWSSRNVLEDFRDFMPTANSGRPTDKWYIPFTERIKRVCDTKGPNPYHPG